MIIDRQVDILKIQKYFLQAHLKGGLLTLIANINMKRLTRKTPTYVDNLSARKKDVRRK